MQRRLVLNILRILYIHVLFCFFSTWMDKIYRIILTVCRPVFPEVGNPHAIIATLGLP